MKLNALLRLAFATAPPLKRGLTSLHLITLRIIMQKARGYTDRRLRPESRKHPKIVLPLIVSTRFQVLFHSPLGVLFTFPSRYCFTIGRQLVFSFGQWSARIPTRFHVSRGTQELTWRESRFRLRGFHPLCRTVPGPSAIHFFCNSTAVL